jgi:putative ABC transport system permease protein
MKALRRAALHVAALLGDAIVLLIRLAALALGPTRLGRLLSSVSIPRYREHRLRTSLTVLGVALGVSVLVAVVLVNRSIVNSVTATFDDIGGKAELSVVGGATGLDESYVDVVTAVPGVAHATPVLEQTTLLHPRTGAAERMLILGVEMLGDEDRYFRTYHSADLDAIRADPIPFLNSRTNLLVTRKLADRYGLAVKDTLSLNTPLGAQPFTIWGILEDDGVGRAFGGFVAVMYYPAMQKAFGRGDSVDRVEVAVKPGLTVSEVEHRIAQVLPRGMRVERPERKNDRMLKMLGALRTGLTMSSLVALLVGMFLIYNTMSISVVQRRRELGILRALGILRGQLLALLTLEGTLLGGVGATLGVGLGILLAKGLITEVSGTVSEVYMRVAARAVEVDALLVASAIALGLAASVLSSLVPALEAMRVQPVETLRTGAFVPRAPHSRRLTLADGLAGAAFVLAYALVKLPAIDGVPYGGYAAGLVTMLGAALLSPRAITLVHAVVTPIFARTVGVEARLASDNLRRDLRRASITTGALMVGVAMTVGVAVFVGSFVHSAMDWVDQTIPADLHLVAGSRFGGMGSVPIADVLSDELWALPGVAGVERLRIAELDYQGTPIKVLATDAKVFSAHAKLLVLEGEHVQEKYERGEVVVSENLARRFGLHAGGTIVLPTRDGEARLPIAGVMIDYTSDQGTVSFDRSVFVRLYGDTRVDAYKLYLEPGADLETVRRLVNERYAEKYDLFVMTYKDFKHSIVALLDQVFSIMSALEVVAIVIAVLGVINALLASVIDRVREIGVLRAVGMRRRQVRVMVMAEGGLVGVCAVLVGFFAGLALGQLLIAVINLTQSGWYFPFRPPWLDILQACLVVVVVSTLAGWYPARAAAKLVVTEALEYE